VTLGERCIDLAFQEMKAGIRANAKPFPNTGPRVREYLAGCVRDVDKDGDDDRLGLKEGNWCMAFQAWLLEQSLQPGEERPHKYRASVLEAVNDARALGRYFPVGKGYIPKSGDLAIWDRSDPKAPGTAWQKHVNRVVSFDPTDSRFVTIGGNEGRQIQLTAKAPKRLDANKLEGFIDYTQEEVERPSDLFLPGEREKVQALIERTLSEINVRT